MSRHARRSFVTVNGLLSCVLTVAAPLSGAQTIADFSRAQRALLESTMSQAAARSAGQAASTPAPAAVALPAVAASSPALRTSMPVLVPVVQVNGIFASSGGAIAEVVVNATAYLLGVGQDVPGTAWHVVTIATDRVVLGRQGGAGVTDTEGARKVFPLPALH